MLGVWEWISSWLGEVKQHFKNSGRNPGSVSGFQRRKRRAPSSLSNALQHSNVQRKERGTVLRERIEVLSPNRLGVQIWNKRNWRSCLSRNESNNKFDGIRGIWTQVYLEVQLYLDRSFWAGTWFCRMLFALQSFVHWPAAAAVTEWAVLRGLLRIKKGIGLL